MQKRTAKPKHHRASLGARFARDGFGFAGTADVIPLWAYALFGLALACFLAAAVLPRAARGLSASFALALAGGAIILGLTIAYAFA